MFIHVVRSLKFALLRDDLAMRNECGLLLQLFDGLTAHNCTSLSSMYTTALLWSALGLENELQTVRLRTYIVFFMQKDVVIFTVKFSRSVQYAMEIRILLILYLVGFDCTTSFYFIPWWKIHCGTIWKAIGTRIRFSMESVRRTGIEI